MRPRLKFSGEAADKFECTAISWHEVPTDSMHGKPMEAIAPDPPTSDLDERLAALPGYIRSLLKIEVTASVVLASKRLPVDEVLNLATGSIVQFDRAYDQPIELVIGDHVIAEGEAVKVGEYFGLRISSITLPEERFARVHAEQQRRTESP